MKQLMNKTKQRILNELKNTYCRLKPSKIEGVGVFAVRSIPKKTNPFKGLKKQAWYKFQISELKTLGKELLSLIDSFFVIHKNLISLRFLLELPWLSSFFLEYQIIQFATSCPTLLAF